VNRRPRAFARCTCTTCGTVGRRLRAAGVGLETRQAILGHKSGSITTHYSAAELRELLEAMEFIATDNQRESHALTLLKRKAG
jgi:hypothetical protein